MRTRSSRFLNFDLHRFNFNHGLWNTRYINILDRSSCICFLDSTIIHLYLEHDAKKLDLVVDRLVRALEYSGKCQMLTKLLDFWPPRSTCRGGDSQTPSLLPCNSPLLLCIAPSLLHWLRFIQIRYRLKL